MDCITERNQLGQTELFVSPFAFGVLTMGYAQLNLPLDEGADLLCYAYEKGINFFDTAQYYKTYPYIKKAFENTKEKPIICTKSLTHSYQGMEEAIKEALREMDLNTIDIFLLHEVLSASDWLSRKEAWRCLIDYKNKGIIRYIGVSTHHVDVAEMASTINECDVVFPLINYAGLGIRKGNGAGSADEMAKAILKCADNGKGVFGMKAFGGGNLTGNYVNALSYVSTLPGISSVMVGIGKKKEIDDLVAFCNKTLPQDYVPDISHKKIRIDKGDCIACGACKKRCPNEAIYIDNYGFATVNHDICLTCGYCAPICPTRAIIMW